MNVIIDSLVLTFLLLRTSKGSVARRICESSLFALFVFGILFRSSGQPNQANA